MKWILMIAWAANGTGYTAQEFDTQQACARALEWAKANDYRSSGYLRGGTRFVCLPKGGL